jgi:tRNA U55 pseudouridine synthase TruB
MSPAEAASAEFPVVSVSDEVAADVRHGRPIDLREAWAPYRDIAADEGEADRWTELAGEHAVFDEAGRFLALVAPNPDGTTKYLAVFG